MNTGEGVLPMRQSGENGLNIFIENKVLTLRWLPRKLWETQDSGPTYLLGLDFSFFDSHCLSTDQHLCLLVCFLNYFEATQIQIE